MAAAPNIGFNFIQTMDTIHRLQAEYLLHYRRMPRTDSREYCEVLHGSYGLLQAHQT